MKKLSKAKVNYRKYERKMLARQVRRENKNLVKEEQKTNETK